MTIAVVLGLLAFAMLAGGCPRKAGDSTTVAIDETKPADTTTTTTTDGSAPAGDTKVDVDVNQGGTAGQTEGDKTTGDAASGDAAANGGDAAAGGDKAAGGDTSGDTGKTDTPAEPAKEDANVTTVILETSKGNITLALHSDWAPIGAAHFLELVNAKYYDGAPWFRVIPGFVAQAGVAADPKMTAEWQDKTIQDEPVKQGNKRGMVAFGQTGKPNSRSTHFFINYADNGVGGPQLDRQGFACFAEVTEGMDVAEKLFPAEFQDQGALATGGIEAFKKQFPNGDTIIKAYVKK